MSTVAQQQQVSESQYLLMEEQNEARHEYINGQVFAMSGAGRNHRILCGNLFAKLHKHLLGGPCEPNMNDARVKVANNYFYPDIVVDCDPDSQADSLYADKPILIVEVLSKSTREQDKGPKLLNYINTETLLEYVLIEPDFVSIEVFRRSEGWILHHYGLNDTIHFESVDLTLDVAEIYQRVDNEDMRAFIGK